MDASRYRSRPRTRTSRSDGGARARGRRGVGLVELALVLPLFVVLFCAAIDVGRLVYVYQVMAGLSREAGMLVSRGATMAQTLAATRTAERPLSFETGGRIVISKVERHSADDATPWVTAQLEDGGLGGYRSRVGALGGPATLPGMATLQTGEVVRVVEMAHVFRPVMTPPMMHVFFPAMVSDVAYF